MGTWNILGFISDDHLLFNASLSLFLLISSLWLYRYQIWFICVCWWVYAFYWWAIVSILCRYVISLWLSSFLTSEVWSVAFLSSSWIVNFISAFNVLLPFLSLSLSTLYFTWFPSLLRESRIWILCSQGNPNFFLNLSCLISQVLKFVRSWWNIWIVWSLIEWFRFSDDMNSGLTWQLFELGNEETCAFHNCVILEFFVVVVYRFQLHFL